jgi:hypothetical protein
MLALLIYSVVATSVAIRKTIQPAVDSAFDVLYALVFLKLPAARRNQSPNEKEKEGESS